MYDVIDPPNPTQTYEYDLEEAFLWTAVRGRGFTVTSDIGGGIAFLHEDRGEKRPTSFDGTDSAPHHDRKQRR